MNDFETTEYSRWDIEPEKDNGHLMLRETPAGKVRARIAQIRLTVHQMTLERDLAFAHIYDHLEHDLVEPIQSVPKTMTWLEMAWENIAVRWCVFVHATPTYRRGDQFSQCPSCERRYALPWADMSKLDADIYVPSVPFVAPTERTLQVKCRNGWMGEV